MTIQANNTYWYEGFERNVDVTRVYRDTVTIETWGGGLQEGRRITFRGVSKKLIRPRKNAEQRAAYAAGKGTV